MGDALFPHNQPALFLSSAEFERLQATCRSSIESFRQGEEPSFLVQLAEADRESLQQFATERTCAPGEAIVVEDMPGDCMYIIRSGLSVVLKGDLSVPIVLGFRGEGDLIGEMALVENQPRSATVVALEPMCLWRITQEAFLQLSGQSPVFSLKLLGMLSARLRRSDEQYREVLAHDRQRNEALVKLSDQVMRDPLTDLYNRRTLDATLAKWISQAGHNGTQIGVMMLDVDHFKLVNDTYGHPVGDRVLQALAKILAHCVRAEDAVCRYGGEEFVVVMPGASMAVIQQRAELIRRSFEEAQVIHAGQRISVTLSIGAAMYPAHGADGAAVLACADRALYRAKHSGRNKVVLCGENCPEADSQRTEEAG